MTTQPPLPRKWPEIILFVCVEKGLFVPLQLYRDINIRFRHHPNEAIKHFFCTITFLPQLFSASRSQEEGIYSRKDWIQIFWYSKNSILYFEAWHMNPHVKSTFVFERVKVYSSVTNNHIKIRAAAQSVAGMSGQLQIAKQAEKLWTLEILSQAQRLCVLWAKEQIPGIPKMSTSPPDSLLPPLDQPLY